MEKEENKFVYWLDSACTVFKLLYSVRLVNTDKIVIKQFRFDDFFLFRSYNIDAYLL